MPPPEAVLLTRRNLSTRRKQNKPQRAAA